MGDGSALELAPGSPQARAFAAVADALVEGLPLPVEARNVQAQPIQALGHSADD